MMEILIIYDSLYGNTEQIALAIKDAIGSQEHVTVLRVGDVKPDQIRGFQLLIVGSPTQRFKPTPAMTNLVNGISKDGLKGIKVAAFDTRLTWDEISKTPVLAFFAKLLGNVYAAKPIADSLKKKGGELIVPPEGFFVEGMEGPLVKGEIERAAIWTKKIIAMVQ